MIRRCQRHSVEEAAGTKSLLLQVTSGCSRRQNMQGWRSSPFMDVVNIRCGKEATTPEATDGWYKVGLMTLGTQLRAVPGMIRNASGPSVVYRFYDASFCSTADRSTSATKMQQLTSLIVCGYDRSRWERLQRAQHVAATISWMPPRDCDGHRTANWQGKWPGAYR